MSNLTDFVIAKDNEGGAIADADRPADHWPTMEAKGVDTVKLATLYSAITGQADAAIRNAFTLAGGDEEFGPWVFKLPTPVVDALVTLAAADIDGVAATWAATEEMQTERWNTIDGADLIGRLQQHAKKARAAGAAMFLWMSL
jgi:hypothetical protein